MRLILTNHKDVIVLVWRLGSLKLLINRGLLGGGQAGQPR